MAGSARSGPSPARLVRPGPGPDGLAERPTIDAVARHALVSRQTVSNAINAPAKVAPETLRRVLASIGELGYQPNQAARDLRIRATRRFGLQIGRAESSGIGSIPERFLHAVTTSAYERGHDVLVFTADSTEEEITRYADLIGRDAVDGFVLTNTHTGDPRPAWLRRRGAHFVAFGRSWGTRTPAHSWVDVDGRCGVELAVAHLVEGGHQRIGYVGWPPGGDVSDDRRDGWRAACREHRRPVRHLDVHGVDGIATGERLGLELLVRADPPTALVCVSDAMAIGAMRAVEALHKRVGSDIAVVGFDDSTSAGIVHPRLTSVRQPLAEVADSIVDLLLAHRTGELRTPRHLVIPPTLVVRESSA